MCELIVCVVDAASDNPNAPARGTVIDVMPDGHVYGTEELAHPIFRILRLPGVPMAFGQAFLGAEKPAQPGLPPPNLLSRAFKLDLDHAAVTGAFRAYLDDEKRQSGHFVADPALLLTLKAKRKAVLDNTVGQPTYVVG